MNEFIGYRPESLEVDKGEGLVASKLSAATQYLDDRNIEYRIVGGVAVELQTGKKIDFKKIINGERDIDILTYQRENLHELQDNLKKVSGLDICLPYTNSLNFKEDGIYLSHYHLTQKVPEKVFLPSIIEFGGKEFITLPPETLFHLYTSVGGSLRAKDYPLARDLLRFIKNNPTEGIEEKDFENFHRFYRKRLKDKLFKFKAKRIKDRTYGKKSIVASIPESSVLRSIFRKCESIYTYLDQLEETDDF